MNTFDAPKLILAIQNLGMVEAQLTTMVKLGQGNRRMDTDMVYARDACENAGLGYVCSTIDSAARYIKDPQNADLSTIRTELRHITDALLKEGHKRGFLIVSEDHVQYLEQDSLFGRRVSERFPSATRDIQEAGNCLAAECPTACVFHLMRAAEVALRACG